MSSTPVNPQVIKVSAGHGAAWISEGWTLFKAAPGQWIAALLIFCVGMVLLSLVPVLGDLAGILIGPFLMVGFLAFTQGIAEDGKADLGQLFIGFREKQVPLILIAVFYLLALIVVGVATGVLAAVFGVFNGDVAQWFEPESLAENWQAWALLYLLFMALALPLAAAYWYAPGLVFYADMGAWAAMKQSFRGVLCNWQAFLVYGLLTLLVTVAGMVALLIGLLVALPVLTASYYASFRDIYQPDVDR